jgi:protein-disulfide isomerase
MTVSFRIDRMRPTRMRALACMAMLVLAMTSIAPRARAGATDVWQEELLLQLSELRKAQGELRQELADLRAEVAGLRAGQSQGERNATIDLASAPHPSLGDADAPLAIVEFSDFQCPYCRKYELATLPALREKYVESGKVRYFFVDFPLSFHKQAQGAAIAAACAQRQDAFWKMHARLFEKQSRLGEGLYLELADEFGLDRGKFQACLADPQVRAGVDDGVALGERVGVRGTPAFFIGRVKDGMLIDARQLSGARPLQDFEKVLDSLMQGS